MVMKIGDREFSIPDKGKISVSYIYIINRRLMEFNTNIIDIPDRVTKGDLFGVIIDLGAAIADVTRSEFCDIMDKHYENDGEYYVIADAVCDALKNITDSVPFKKYLKCFLQIDREDEEFADVYGVERKIRRAGKVYDLLSHKSFLPVEFDE